jgi:hypothetical protein
VWTEALDKTGTSFLVRWRIEIMLSNLFPEGCPRIPLGLCESRLMGVDVHVVWIDS